MSYSAIHNYLSCIVSFYKINDIILNTKKICKFMPQQKKAQKKIGAILMKRFMISDISDERTRAIILLLASRYDKLLTSLRTAYAEELNLKKDVTSYDDLLDSLRLSLKGYQIK
jgi:hypothetical protein